MRNLSILAWRSDPEIKKLMHTPGGAFGSCRHKLKEDFNVNKREYRRLIDVFQAHNIGYFFYNGGTLKIQLTRLLNTL